MKCNVKAKIKQESVDRLTGTIETVKRLWELATLLALTREFGFGEKRLKRFADGLRDVYSEIDNRASITDMYDKMNRKMTNIDEAVIRVIRELRSCGIDHRKILGEEEKLVIYRENGSQIDLDKFVDELERCDRERVSPGIASKEKAAE